MTRILIADDHAIVRDGLRRILTEKMGRPSFGEARDAAETLQLVAKQKWDAVILDISLPGRSGLDALKEIHARHPRLPVLVLSMHPEDQFAVRAIKAGASGYIVKESAPEVLVEALKKAMSGRKYITPSLAERLAEETGGDGQAAPHKALSDREYQVLCSFGKGKTVADVAQDLSLSVKTISTYRARILQKMKMRRTAELIRYAIQNKLVD